MFFFLNHRYDNSNYTLINTSLIKKQQLSVTIIIRYLKSKNIQNVSICARAWRHNATNTLKQRNFANPLHNGSGPPIITPFVPPTITKRLIYRKKYYSLLSYRQ